jgi:hypothetical protein
MEALNRSRLSPSGVIILSLILPAFAQTENCRVLADADILGLGVRIGLYFQTASTLLVALIKPDEWAGSYMSTALFFLSFFIAVIYSIARHESPPGALITCTWHPVLVMTALVPIDFGLYKPRERFRRLTLYVMCVLTSGCLSVWFWFKGLDIHYTNQCMEPRVFFFYNFSAYGNVRTLFKCLSIGFISLLIIAFVFGIGGHHQTDVNVQTISGSVQLPTAPLHAAPPQLSRPSTLAVPITSPTSFDTTSPRSATLPISLIPRRTPTDSVLPGPLVRIHTALIDRGKIAQRKVDNLCWFVPGAMIWLSFYIVASELQLRWNHLDGINSVTSTGQIIPLSLGCLSLFRTLVLLRHVNWLELIKIPPITYAEVWRRKAGELEAERRRI